MKSIACLGGYMTLIRLHLLSVWCTGILRRGMFLLPDLSKTEKSNLLIESVAFPQSHIEGGRLTGSMNKHFMTDDANVIRQRS